MWRAPIVGKVLQQMFLSFVESFDHKSTGVSGYQSILSCTMRESRHELVIVGLSAPEPFCMISQPFQHVA